MKATKLAILAIGLISTGALAASPTRVCGKYSTVLLDAGETAIADGAGHSSLSLTIRGPSGNWIFYDSISESAASDGEGALILTDPKKTVYRRNFNRQIYSVQQTQPTLKDGKIVKVGVMGVDLMRVRLDNAAIVGDDSDITILERVLPGEIGQCDLRFVAGQGLVTERAE
jgi:hypothetical protein